MRENKRMNNINQNIRLNEVILTVLLLVDFNLFVAAEPTRAVTFGNFFI